MGWLKKQIGNRIIGWLTYEEPQNHYPLSDFERILYEIRQCDVILIEGRSRVSNVIRISTQSPWTHAALYIGRLHDLENDILREHVKQYYSGDPNEPLILESILGKGTIVSTLSKYKEDHMRICRPKGISRKDAQEVIRYALSRLGIDYDTRNIFDLLRLLFPWSFIPRRYRSSLFERNVGTPTRQICSSLLAEAFASVRFPILPLVKRSDNNTVELIPRNPRLTTPCDFDYSPYFDIIKYSFFALDEHAIYRDLPWNESGSFSDNKGKVFKPKIIYNQKKKEEKRHWFSFGLKKASENTQEPAEDSTPDPLIKERDIDSDQTPLRKKLALRRNRY
ncbi:MAG: uncharacterized protein K0R12_1329 [Gammaproteobacteria bacterium]|jgi:hypothetical protein|nr:uncharacterized protein [Gammaproteobacteria bacterium]